MIDQIRRDPLWKAGPKTIKRFVAASEAISGEIDHTKRHTEIARHVAQTQVLLHPVILHYSLFNGIQTGGRAGKYRSSIRGGREGVSPPAQDVARCMDDWFVRLVQGCEEHREAETNAKIIFAQKMHFEFLSIDAFNDGNGRLGRLIRNMVRGRLGVPWHIITPATIKRERDAYRQHRSRFVKTLM
ncbi:MAG: Fic family protein [Candidatus Paceibacterota bacterium]